MTVVKPTEPIYSADLTAEFRVPEAFRIPGQTRTSRRNDPSVGPRRSAYAPVPLPPTDAEKYVYDKRRLPVLMIASLVSFSCLLASQTLLLRSTPAMWVLAPAVGFTIIYYVISAIVNVFTKRFSFQEHDQVVTAWRPSRYPSVDVFLPVCGEPAHVLQNTWANVRDMARAYPGPVYVHVLDDSPEPTLRRMAMAFRFGYVRRHNRGWFKKAGNLRNAFEHTSADFILILDADFAPRPDMINEMLPYFYTEPKIGIVQSPQFFRVHAGQGWVERGAGTVQELFYRSVQVSRQTHGAAICVGSCAIYRRDALNSIGGTALIEHSEDVHTGFDLKRAGWKLRYIPVALAAGLCPADVNSFFTQQYRWCAGSMSLLGSGKFWQTKLALRARLSYLSGFMYYLHTALFTFVAPLIPIAMLYFFPYRISLANYLLILPSILYNTLIFPLWHRSRYRLDAWTVKMIYGWAHAFAIFDILRGRRMGWQPTGGVAKKSKTRRVWIGMSVWTGGTAVFWVGGAAYQMLHTNALRYAAVFLTGMFFLTVAAQALLVDPGVDSSEVVA
jgi:cellulose synthase (UDP-forming)